MFDYDRLKNLSQNELATIIEICQEQIVRNGKSIKNSLTEGEKVSFYSHVRDSIIIGTLLEKKRKRGIVKCCESGDFFDVPFYALESIENKPKNILPFLR